MATRTNTKTKSLNDDARQRLADQIRGGEIGLDDYENLKLKVITGVTGRHFSIDNLLRASQVTVAPLGDPIGERIHLSNRAFVIAEPTLERFGFASAPLDETLAQVTVDLSGRPFLVYNVKVPDRKIKAFDLGLFEDFFQAFVTHGGLNLHVNLLYGRNPHHIMEAIFKALAKALDQATMLEERLAGKVLSTKGML
jgi:hypothetical protein